MNMPTFLVRHFLWSSFVSRVNSGCKLAKSVKSFANATKCTLSISFAIALDPRCNPNSPSESGSVITMLRNANSHAFW